MAPPRRTPGMTPARLATSAAARTAALGLVAGALVLAGSSPAMAHDGLVGTNPAAGATVAEAPDSLELDFTGEPLPLGTLVAVTGPDGAPVSVGDAEIRGTTVVQTIDGDADAGTYRVEWRSTSSDGHALSGVFDFTVAGDPTAPTAGTSPAGSDTTSGAAPADDASADEGIAPVWPVAGAVVLAGLGALLVPRLRRRG